MMRRLLSLFLIMTAVIGLTTTTTTSAAAAEPGGVRQLLERVVGPERAGQVTLVLEPAGASEWFDIATEQGRLRIAGNSPSALLMGFNWYLKYVARADVSINGSQLGPATLPLPTAPIRRTSTVPHRFGLNDTNEGYTGPYQTWAEWERHLDVLALNGVNEALVYVGQEAVYHQTFQQYGYTDGELRQWIPQPGHQPWWLLQNLCCFASPVSTQLIDRRIELGRKIITRMRELGITPVLPGYYGTVPPQFAAKNPGARTVPQGEWGGGFTRSDWLDPTGDVFRRVAATFYQVQRQLFGATTLYKMDLLHEGGTAGPVPVADASRAVQAALAAAHPQALWAILGWENNPLPATLSAVDRSKLLVLDGISELDHVTNREADFQGAAYAFGTIWNFGGHTGISAPLHSWNRKFHAWRTKSGSRLRGIALMPEAIDNNPAAVEFFAELPWQTGPVDMAAWFADYARARYGVDDPHAVRAWQLLGATAYNAPGTWDPKELTGLFGFRPELDARAGELNYPAAGFDQILRELLQVPAGARTSGAYRYDLVDVTRQVLNNRSRDLLPQIAAAYRARDLTTLQRLNVLWLELMERLEGVLATDQHSLLGVWLEDAKRMAATPAESATLEYDARALITTWGDRRTEGFLGNYSRREWAGLVGDYYLPRWRLFLTGLETALQQNRQPAPIDWYAVGDTWSRKRNTFPTTPAGDVHQLASQVAVRLADEPQLAALEVSASPIAVQAGQSTTVTATVRNTNGFKEARDVTLSPVLPSGLTARPLTAVSTAELASGASFTARWQVTAGQPSDLTALARVTASVTFGTTKGTVAAATSLLTGSGVDASYRTFSSNFSSFAQHGSKLGIHGGGADVWLDVEEFGMIYRPAALRHEYLATVKVDRQDATGPWGRAGLFVRNAIGPDNLGAVNLAVTPSNGCVLSSDSDGNGRFDTVHTAPGIGATAWLRLHRGPAGFTADCSSNGTTWTRLGVVAAPGTKATQDVGVFMTAGNGGNGRTGLTTFDNLQVVPMTSPPALN